MTEEEIRKELELVYAALYGACKSGSNTLKSVLLSRYYYLLNELKKIEEDNQKKL